MPFWLKVPSETLTAHPVIRFSEKKSHHWHCGRGKAWQKSHHCQSNRDGSYFGRHSFKLCIYTGFKHEYLKCTREKKCNKCMDSANSHMLFFWVIATPPKEKDSFCKRIQCHLNINLRAIHSRSLNVDHWVVQYLLLSLTMKLIQCKIVLDNNGI